MNKLPDQQVGYWDSVAAKKTFTHPLDIGLLRQLTHEDSNILDYGCGYGRTCAELASLGYRRVTGLDISRTMIARGHAQFPGLNLRVHTNLPLPFRSGTFDICLVFAVLTCIPSDAGQRALLAELYRILRPAGILYISDYPIQMDERNQLRYLQFRQEYGVFGVFRLPDGCVVRHHDMAWVHELLTSFTPISERELEVLTMNGNPAKVFQMVVRKREVLKGKSVEAALDIRH